MNKISEVESINTFPEVNIDAAKAKLEEFLEKKVMCQLQQSDNWIEERICRTREGTFDCFYTAH